MRVAIATLGCKVNRYDTAVLERRVAEKGWQNVPFDHQADAYVVNTCTVTDRADRDARRLARAARRRNPAARVVLTGCWAQASPATVAALPEVDYVVGLGRVDHLLDAVAGELPHRVEVQDLRRATKVETLGVASVPGRSRALVKVQEGCDLFCTFCIVPVARGRSRSVSAREVLEEIERLAGRGYREVVLTGVHLGGWGADLEPARDLAWLLECIAERAPAVRIRVGSIDPPELGERLYDVLSDSARFCPHLHVPIQSGDDGVLGRMGRRYTARQARQALELARLRLGDDVALGVDVITGFPGETDEQYETTRAFLEDLAPAYAHVFPYSVRSFTSAAKRWEALPDAVVHGRARQLRERESAWRNDYRRRFLDRDVQVVFEGERDPATGRWTGTSAHYVPVACATPRVGHDEDLRGRLATVRVQSEGDTVLLGELA